MPRFVLLLVLGCLLSPLLPTRVRAELPATGLFARTNLVAWCIVPFDSRKRGPEERAAMLEQLGVRRLAYDWRAEHIPTFGAEVAALQKHGIELTAWWFPADLNAEAQAILACLERHQLKTQLWVTMGTEPEADPQRLAQKINGAVQTLSPICTAAARLGCTVGLYNHLGWFGEPTNQVVVLEKLRQAGHTNVGSVYNFHHAHAHIDDFAQQLQVLKPHLLAINLNGMVWEGDQRGQKIIPLGTGDEELRMLQQLQASGWSGPVGIIGHTDDDAEVKLRRELVGLEKLAPLARQSPAPAPKRQVRSPAPDARTASPLPAAGPAVIQDGDRVALDARVSGALLAGQPEFRTPPFQVDVTARLGRADSWNILAASEAKSSPTHWELYTFAGTGELSFYAPGLVPDTIRSGVPVCDGQWHVFSAVVEPGQVRLRVDGKDVARQAVKRLTAADAQAAQFAIGRLVEGGLGCDGQIHQVQFTSLSGASPKVWALEPWVLLAKAAPDQLAALTRAPGVPAVGGTQAVAGAARTAGEPASSGREPGSQGEKDWVDNRWQDTDMGPFLASNLRLGNDTVLAKGLTVKVGSNDAGAVVYDTATGALRAAWTPGFVRVGPTRFGLIDTLRPASPEAWISLGPKEADPTYRFVGIHRGAQPVLEYQQGGTRFLEQVDLRTSPVGPVFVRTLRVDPHTNRITLLAAGHLAGTNVATHNASETHNRDGVVSERSWSLTSNDRGSTRSAVGVLGGNVISSRHDLDDAGGRLSLVLEPASKPTVLSLFLWRGTTNDGPAFQEFIRAQSPGKDPAALVQVAPGRWPTVTTRGQRGADTDILAVDTLTLPYDNPSKALLFGSGIDFTPDGAGYLCTIHGDVWKVTGIDNALQSLKWQRYATGLFQPLGLKVRDGKVYVLGRDRITRLHDENGDGEADFYESFFDGIQTSTGGHDYVTCLETDTQGNFYYTDPVGVHRVSADGRNSETRATGFRNPNGMGVSPDGSVVTVAPQQGTWTPTSFIAETRPSGYYGYGGPKVTPERPLGYDAPLCWIPHSVDNSSGSQVWVPSGKWGPLSGQMLHLLWGRCGLMLVLRDAAPGQPARQGAVVPLPGKLLSGPNRGTFHPDGSLFVAGSTGWQTSAVKDGSLQRVRFTGKRVGLPVGFHVRSDGLELTFSQPLDRATAEDVGSYGLKQWNYRYAEAYGSKDWSVANPDREGRDDVTVKSARLLPNGRSVFLEIPGLKPVMQLEVKYNVDATDGGKPLTGQLWMTVNN